jgi:hypothetical protein
MSAAVRFCGSGGHRKVTRLRLDSYGNVKSSDMIRGHYTSLLVFDNDGNQIGDVSVQNEDVN